MNIKMLKGSLYVRLQAFIRIEIKSANLFLQG
jgi:hypothetical protein